MSISLQPSVTEYAENLNRLILNCQVTNKFEQQLALEEGLDEVKKILYKTRESGGTVYCIGNGGSAAISSHVSNDLTAGAQIRSQVLTDIPLLTAFTNDHGYAAAYAKQLKIWIRENDLLIAISSSGKSENILQAAAVAKNAGASTITFSGFDSKNPLRSTGEFNFYLPISEYGLVEMGHSVLCHYLTDCLGAGE